MNDFVGETSRGPKRRIRGSAGSMRGWGFGFGLSIVSIDNLFCRVEHCWSVSFGPSMGSASEAFV